ncbi:hypothetical protein Baya_5649 [Bagarius yarrelli]|uniref:Uncharacterized protein n=1 Tax=Bagarius yarrelli TaxID=175774 RepID=A0A556TWA7_BAGYA|nr:hypothetical protein Baya_5649 [Bagarius yarrelli]
MQHSEKDVNVGDGFGPVNKSKLFHCSQPHSAQDGIINGNKYKAGMVYPVPEA